MNCIATILILGVALAALFIVFGAGIASGMCGGIKHINKGNFEILDDLDFPTDVINLAKYCLDTN